jgi:hypothetical protein
MFWRIVGVSNGSDGQVFEQVSLDAWIFLLFLTLLYCYIRINEL